MSAMAPCRQGGLFVTCCEQQGPVGPCAPISPIRTHVTVTNLQALVPAGLLAFSLASPNGLQPWMPHIEPHRSWSWPWVFLSQLPINPGLLNVAYCT